MGYFFSVVWKKAESILVKKYVSCDPFLVAFSTPSPVAAAVAIIHKLIRVKQHSEHHNITKQHVLLI